MEWKYDGMEARYDPMEWKYDPMEQRYDPMEWKYDPMEERYDPMEWQDDPMEEKYGPVEHGYDPMEYRWRLDCIFVHNAPPFKAGLKSQTRQENTTKMKIWKTTTAKFKCMREHILGHDWLIKITWG